MKIALLPGDGIGPEIMAQAERVIGALANDGLAIETETAAVGGAGHDAAGDPLPAATLALCESADAILFGAVYPFVKDPVLLPIVGFALTVPIYVLVAVLFGIVVLGEGARLSLVAALGMAVAGAVATGGVVLLSRHHPDAENRHLLHRAAAQRVPA